jgi:plasmid stabilization system protein ParE
MAAALRDLERLFEFLAAEDPVRARTQVLSIRRALRLRRQVTVVARRRRRIDSCGLPST